MAVGRLLHYAFDAVLLSTVLAGIRRSTGYTPQTSGINDPTLRSVAERFLGVGETVFDMAQGTVVNSSYFKRESNQ